MTLHDLVGFDRKSGTDQHNCQWIQYELEDISDGLDSCCICGAAISWGWLCLDGGDTCCDKHISYEATTPGVP